MKKEAQTFAERTIPLLGTEEETNSLFHLLYKEEEKKYYTPSFEDYNHVVSYMDFLNKKPQKFNLQRRQKLIDKGIITNPVT